MRKCESERVGKWVWVSAGFADSYIRNIFVIRYRHSEVGCEIDLKEY